VRALFVIGGNPLLSWPNQAKTRRALESLELLVVVDPVLSETARHAHYVIGPRFGFESPAITFGNEGITVYGLSLGYPEPYAQYQPQLVEPPAGSDVLEDWRIFYELGRRMGYPLAFRGQPFDMSTPPTTDGLLSQFVARSRVPLEEIKRHPHGAVFPDPKPSAEPRDAEWPHRLQLAAPVMIAELEGIAAQRSAAVATAAATTMAPLMGDEGGGLRLLMVSRREHALYNSVAHDLPALRRRLPHNPAHLNPVDAARLGVVDGATVEIASSVGRILAVVHLAADVREGVVSIAHGFADACTAALIDDATDYEALSGLPRMSAVPVMVRPAIAAPTRTTA
jgi:anaerobic selenocysteine-containing dehydrogenase